MRFTPFLVAASLAAGAAALTAAVTSQAQTPPANAQPGAPAMVSAQTSGTIIRYIVGPMGHVRGFALNNGAVVWVHGHGGDALAQSAPVGQAVRVDGLAPAATPHVIRHATVYGANGAVLAAPPNGTPGAAGAMGPHMRNPQMRGAAMARFGQLPQHNASGTVQIVVPGPRGRIHVLLLSDGSTIYLHGAIAHEVNRHGVNVGDSVQVSGRGNAYPLGAAVMAESVTFADGTSVTAPQTPPSP
jgi:hypothetical protein